MPYNGDKAQFAVDFIGMLKHTKDPWYGVPFDLLPWQDKIIRDVFGTVRDDGYRQYNFSYTEIPKKNGKSEIGSAVGLYMTCGDGERGAEVYGCAADRQQASIVFDVAFEMVDQCPALKKRIKPVLSQKRMVYQPTHSFYQVLSAEAFSKHGLNVHACIFDELHAQPNRQLYDVMTKGSGDARMQPLFFIITTSGDDPDRKSIGWEVHKKAVDVLLGNKVDPTFYATVYGIEPEEKRIWSGKDYEIYPGDLDKAWKTDSKIWYLTNPSLGHTVKENKVAEAIQAAEGNPADERSIRWLRFNEWVKFKTTKWVPLTVWDSSSRGSFDRSILTGRRCYGGLDLSSTTDITAFILLFPPVVDDPFWYVLPFFWIPEDNMKERIQKDKIQYDQWVDDGLVNVTPGNVIDYDFIRKLITGESDGGEHTHCLADEFNIVQIGFDDYNATQLTIQLQKDLGDNTALVNVDQGIKSISPVVKELEVMLGNQILEHGGNPVLRWMFGNIEVRKDESDNIKPVKAKSTGRIDGIIALLVALSRAIAPPEDDEGPSKYETDDLVVL